MKKFKLHWQSVVVGMILCAVLGMFVGSKIAEPQTATDQAKSRVMQNQVTMTTLMNKCETIDQRVLIVEGKIGRLQEDMNRVLDDTGNIRRLLEKR